MDVYASQKIKTTVKTVGTLILIIFYSSLVDFYYIGPYIHNILSELKFLVNSKSANAKLVHKIFIDINTMLLDSMDFFNGFNRAVIKDVKKHLSGDVIYNERIFLNLRGVINSVEIMNMCRDYSGSKNYNELIESQKIKPKVKSDVRIKEQKKTGDEVKLEKNVGSFFKFLSFKRATKRNLFLGKDINMKEYTEYQDIYQKSVENIKNLEGPLASQGESKKEKNEENNIMEVFDFINNVTNTDKDNEAKIKELSFWTEGQENQDNSNKNEETQLTFGFDFDFGEIANQNKKTGEDGKKKEEKLDIVDAFDFSNNNSNSNNKENKVDNKNKGINNNNNNKKEIKNEKAPEKKNDDFNYSIKSKTFRNNQLLDFFNNNNNNNNLNQNNSNNNKNDKIFDFNKFNNQQNDNKTNNNTNNTSFNFDNFKIMNNNNTNNINSSSNGFNNMSNFNNQTNQNQKNSNNSINNNSNNNTKDDNLNNLLASFNFPNQNNNTTSVAQFIPSFPNNNNSSNSNNNNNNFNQQNNSQKNNLAGQEKRDSFFSSGFVKNSAFNFSGFDFNNQSPFQKKEEEILMILKEKVSFYYNFTTGNKIVNVLSKGYLGLTTKEMFVKNKDFIINFKTEKIKDQQYIQTEFDKRMEKINDLSYKIHFDNFNSKETLLNYIINPNILAQNRILEPFIEGEKNQLKYKFMYNNNIKKEILRIEINVLYKTILQNGNLTKSDGTISANNNNQINIIYNKKIVEGKIEFPNNINVFSLVGKIVITIHLKEDVISEMNVEVKDNNYQKILKSNKETQISYEFS